MRLKSGSNVERIFPLEQQASVCIHTTQPGEDTLGAAGCEKRTRSKSIVRESRKCSVVFLNTHDEQSKAKQTGSDNAVSKPELHPGLTRLTSFMKRKSVFRGKMASISELSAAMDTLDRRIITSLEDIRSQNAAGLGDIRALHRSRSGRLVPNCSPTAKELIPAYSPRKIFGDAVDDASILQRLKFHIDEQQALHDGGISSARGRLQDTLEDSEMNSEQNVSELPESTQLYFLADKKRHTIAIPNAAFGSPKWGATEGGRDTLGWVRSLVQFTESQAFMEMHSSSPDAVSTLAALAEHRPEPNHSKPSRRQDVLRLQTWLQEMMGQVLAQMGSRSTSGQEAAAIGTGAEALMDKAPVELAESALWMYGVAFEELQRQMATESKDRADLLSAMWEHCFNLVELRCSLMYEEIISGIKQELQSARQHGQQLQAQVRHLEERMAKSTAYNKEEFLEMKAENKRAMQLLAAAQEENEEVSQEVLRLKTALQVETALKSNAEAELRVVCHQKDDLSLKVDQMTGQAQQQSETLSSNKASIAKLEGDLQHSQERLCLLLEEKTVLEVDIKQAERDFQAAEIRVMSLKEQLSARSNELAQLRTEYESLQGRHASTSAGLQEAKSSLQSLRQDLEVHQRTSAETKGELQRSVDKLESSLREVHSQHAALQLDKQGVENRLKESIARENVFSSQLKQLATSHEQQGVKLRQETESRKVLEDELQALRAGLQVSQQKLECMGMVFASNVVHHASSQAWAASGPISMGRQVVAVINQQLTNLVAKQKSLEHDLAVAKEHWQAEEKVRIRHQEQLLDTKAQLSKMTKEKEALNDQVSRLEQQRRTLDHEITQMRRMLSETEARSQAAQRKSIEAAADVKRLLPLEAMLKEAEERQRASKADESRLQQELASQQTTIRGMLDEKAALLEQLSQRTQALDAAAANCTRLSEEAKERERLQQLYTQIQEELNQHLMHRSAQESVLHETMRQLAVAKQLLVDLNDGVERQKLGAADAEVRRLHQLLAERGTEVDLLQQRLTSTEQQLRHVEEQLRAMPAYPHSPRPKGSPRDPGAWNLETVVEQLRRVLEVKEDRIRQLQKGSGVATATQAQVKQLQADVVRKDAEIAKLDKELDAIRRKLHSLQEGHMKMASRDLIALATDAHLPPDLAKEMMHKHVHGHLRSEILWTKAKLAFVSCFAKNLRIKLHEEQQHRARAELESMCVEAFYLQQAIADQRAASALFTATFVQTHQSTVALSLALEEVVKQMVEPGREELGRLQGQLGQVLAELGRWGHTLQGRADKALQVNRQEDSIWKELMRGLPEARPSSDSALAAASLPATVVHVYAHSIQPCLTQARTISQHESVYDAVASYFVEQRGCTRQEVTSSTGPVVALLVAAQAHQHRPKQLLLLQLAGLSDGSAARSLPEGAWVFVQELLLCTARLQGASWQTFVKEWSGCEDGAALPVQCVMDILANVYNTDAPALLDCARRSLVPLLRQGRRGPAIDMDAFLLVMLNEFAEGRCPVSPLFFPRRLTDGSLANALNYHANPPTLPMLMAASVATTAAGLADPYAPSPTHMQEGRRQRGAAVRKRLVNFTEVDGGGRGSRGGSSSPDMWTVKGGALLALPAGSIAASSQPRGPGRQETGASSRSWGEAAAGTLPEATIPCSSGSTTGGGGERDSGSGRHRLREPRAGSPGGGPCSPEIYHTMQSLVLSNPSVSMGTDSPLRRSAATSHAKGQG